MIAETPAPFRALKRLRLEAADGAALRLRSSGAVMEVQALASDVFRVRAARGRVLGATVSWAVVTSAWPPPPARRWIGGGQVGLVTAEGGLSVRLEDGSWRLADAAGLEVFAAPAGGMGFLDQATRCTLGLAPGERLLGLGETTGGWDKRGLRRELWNIDVLGHVPAIYPGLRSMYASIPFLISLREGRAAGLFFDNLARQVWDLGRTTPDRAELSADAGDLDLYLFLGPSLERVLERFTALTGRMPLPPRWALGYHQSRYSYESRHRVEDLAREFRRRQIPCDVVHLDIHHLEGYRVFTFGRSFPRPRQMLQRLRRRGFHVVSIVDPGVKEDPRFGVWRRGRRQNAFVKAPGGRADYLGEVWPGRSRFPDFFRAAVRAWWGREQTRLQELGVAGFWNDMNEPANFALPSKTLPPACQHQTDFGPRPHLEVHNGYGMQMARASREGALAHDPTRRPLIISRAGYAGVQRYALLWTGDNSSCWEHLADSIPLLLNLSLSGVAFCGCDTGGFLDDASGELLARWTQLAAFTPFFRNHSNLGTRAQEPWAFGPHIEAICRQYIELRYQLHPYLYGLFAEAHRHGTPIMRPLAWHWQNDPVAVATADQFMLGASLLVAPILRPAATARAVYLPVGNWFDFWTGRAYRGPQQVLAAADLPTLPLFVRAGTILPLAALRQHLSGPPPEVINLHLWPGAPGELLWHEDDGLSQAYTTGGCLERRVTFRPRRRGGVLELSPVVGGYASPVRRWRILLRATERPYRVAVNGRRQAGRFDPETRLFAFETPNTPGRLEARWW